MNHELHISLNTIGRRFNRDWIFRNINYAFTTGNSYAILGANGSGKSTLLQILNGSLAASAGTITYQLNGNIISIEAIYQHLSLAAPYLELIEDFTLNEMIDFHFKFKSCLKGIGKTEIINLLNLNTSTNKLIRYFSSGMKQRLKLVLAFCSDTSILMLDEPTSNLDAQGIRWYQDLVQQFAAGRLMIVCSNQLHEYEFCTHQLNIADYKLQTTIS